MWLTGGSARTAQAYSAFSGLYRLENTEDRLHNGGAMHDHYRYTGLAHYPGAWITRVDALLLGELWTERA
jgi:hypothetical protein